MKGLLKQPEIFILQLMLFSMKKDPILLICIPKEACSLGRQCLWIQALLVDHNFFLRLLYAPYFWWMNKKGITFLYGYLSEEVFWDSTVWIVDQPESKREDQQLLFGNVLIPIPGKVIALAADQELPIYQGHLKKRSKLPNKYWFFAPCTSSSNTPVGSTPPSDRGLNCRPPSSGGIV